MLDALGLSALRDRRARLDRVDLHRDALASNVNGVDQRSHVERAARRTRRPELRVGVVVTLVPLIPPIGWAALLFLLPLWLGLASLLLWRRATPRGLAAEPEA